MDFTFFNPQSQKETDFLASFVARQDTLAFFLRQLRLLGPAEVARHHLIIAPRGFGKTSLLRRVAIAVRADDSLRRHYIPLSFREEQHNVISLDVFWRNCLQALLEAREEELADDTEIDAIDAAWARLEPRQARPRESQDGEPAWQELRDRCAGLGRRPILLIDNLDTLLGGLDHNGLWSLRQTLQQPDGPVLIAAASRYPDATHDQQAAFYDFFRIHTLDRLDDPEVLKCLRSLALNRGDSGRAVLELLDRDPGRIAALNTLAGGNPRTLSVLYTVLESHMSTDVFSQLGAMLDTFTGWYQARMEELPMQARAVFDALALNWDPMTAARLGRATGLAVQAVSSQLSRLEKLGYVEPVALSRRGKGRSGYQVAERFFNIWYLMRNGPRRARQRIKFLAVFLQSCFNASERHALGHDVLASECADPSYAVALATTIRSARMRDRLLEKAQFAALQASGGDEYHDLIRELQSPLPATPSLAPPSGPDHRRIDDRPRPDPPSRRKNDHTEPASTAARRALFEAVSLGSRGPTDEELAAYDAVVARFERASEPACREVVASALNRKGVSLSRLGRGAAALLAYDDVLARYREAREPALREEVAYAAYNKGVTLESLDRNDEAVASYDDVVARFGADQPLSLRELVACALVNQGHALTNLGRSEEAIAVCDRVVARFGEAKELPLRVQVARAMVNKGHALTNLGRSEEALTAYDDVLAGFGEASETVLLARVARAMANKGHALGVLGRGEEAINIYDDVIDRFGRSSAPALREPVARAMVNKGFTLSALGRGEDALTTYDDVIARFGEDSEPALREQVARAMFNKAFRLSMLDRHEEELGAYDALVARFGTATEPALLEQVARGLVNKGIELNRSGRREESAATFRDIVLRFDGNSHPALRDQMAIALSELADLELESGETGAAEAELRHSISLATNPAAAWTRLGNLLLDFKGDAPGAAAAFRNGLSVVAENALRAILEANLAYVLALYLGEPQGARDRTKAAMSIENNDLQESGRALLSALLHVPATDAAAWAEFFDAIKRAVDSGDPTLWKDYFDDLQRLLSFAISNGQGDALRAWMESSDYPLLQAPLYHAVVAATSGEDYLLTINPEMRVPAQRIYDGIARRLRLYARPR